MNKCCDPDHPHCTQWVLPGAHACAVGHAQPVRPDAASFNLLATARAARSGLAVTTPPSPQALATDARINPRPYLHISGFDPRAAGGRQTLRLDLRALPDDGARQVNLALASALLPQGRTHHVFARALHGHWCPVYVEFSSRGKEHGQYRIDVELHSQRDGQVHRRWTCTLVVLVPRADATLGEIHQTFLATHKNVRVSADDASIARLHAAAGGGRIDIDVSATNASIAQVDVDARGKIDLGFPTIAWDEDLIELDVQAAQQAHPHPARSASIVNAMPAAGEQRHLRLFAGDECVLGRFEDIEPEADLLLAHFGAHGMDRAGLTRRISGRHAIIRRSANGFEIEDVSRYGLLLDGVWPGKYVPVPLRAGMRIELTASIRHAVVLEVGAVLPHGVILQRIDAGAAAECFYVLAADTPLAAAPPGHALLPQASQLPLVFHAAGGFWHLDPATGERTALGPQTEAARLAQMPAHARFAATAYPEHSILRDSAETSPPAPRHPTRPGSGASIATA